MDKYLIDYALKNIWTNPRADRPLTIVPAQIVSSKGIRGFMPLPYENTPLPSINEAFIVYQLAAFTLNSVGIHMQPGVDWNIISDLMEENDTRIDITLHDGRMINRATSYIKDDYSGSMLLAIPFNVKQLPIGVEVPTVSFYKNSWLRAQARPPSVIGLKANGCFVEKRDDSIPIITEYSKLKKTMPIKFYRNGFLIKDLVPSHIQQGDWIEYVADDSVAYITSQSRNNIPSFYSARDKRTKYIMHVPKNLTETQYIHELHDSEFYLTGKNEVSVKITPDRTWEGRMLTHHDYAIDTACIDEVIRAHPSIFNGITPKLDVYIHHSGYERQLPNEASRIHELYKQNDIEILRTLTGHASLLDNWKAEQLEKSLYPELMINQVSCYDIRKVEDTLGWNTMTRILEDSPVMEKIQDNIFSIPPALQHGGVAYEYNTEGCLHNVIKYRETQRFIALPNTRYVDYIGSPYRDDGMDVQYNKHLVPVDPLNSYRVYRRDKNTANAEWHCITGTDLYNTKDDLLEFEFDVTNYDTLVITEKNHYYKSYTAKTFDDLAEIPLSVPLNVGENLGDLHFHDEVLWLNGHELVEKLDYHMRDGIAYLTNKEYILDNNAPNLIQMRISGLPCIGNRDLVREDVGFIKDGKVSANHAFNVRDDKVVRITVNGCVKDRTELDFAENYISAQSNTTQYNGCPYKVFYPKASLVGVSATSERRDELFTEAYELDQKIGEFYTAKYPTDKINTFTIPSRYMVFSPFIASIINAINANILRVPEKDLTPELVEVLIAPYNKYLVIDPLRNRVDNDFVIVHPHQSKVVITLTLPEYNFVTYLCNNYLETKLDLSYYIKLGNR